MEMYNFHTHYTLHVTSVLCEYNNREGEVKELILNVESGSITGVTCGRRDALWYDACLPITPSLGAL